ncbi:hypothetical protein [Yoonia litorea]|uniref:Uncharacterized protein n=1 Tax=Yoonia litorea TaxID=1123755 RepID=A0A1I6LLJ3_9RHOB|nr:hypothetical protein [Yoonia litorea]SFS04259.1 hypothetical protein SAMN05444714_0652 [Yoonia litorea]
MAGIGHNSGRVDEPGKAWRSFVWKKARKDLVGVLPVEIIRRRVRRAEELGLPYKTYAGIRAHTGHDLIGFLFSNNALRILRTGDDLPLQQKEKLRQVTGALRHAIVHRPVSVERVAAMEDFDRAFAAPAFTDSWSEMRTKIKAIATTDGQPADRWLMIGDTAFEREWAEAGRMAGYLTADDFFGAGRAAT